MTTVIHLAAVRTLLDGTPGGRGSPVQPKVEALGSPESVLEAVRDHETDREVEEVRTLSDVLYVANKIANRTSSWRDPELDGEVDTSMLDTLFDAETLAEIVEESEEEVQSLKVALGG